MISRSDVARWTHDPRHDLASDSEPWTRLLAIAFEADGDDPNGTFGVLHGLRCCGAGLERDGRGRYRLVAGVMDPDEYGADRQRWLVPHAARIRELLRRLELTERS